MKCFNRRLCCTVLCTVLVGSAALTGVPSASAEGLLDGGTLLEEIGNGIQTRAKERESLQERLNGIGQTLDERREERQKRLDEVKDDLETAAGEIQERREERLENAREDLKKAAEQIEQSRDNRQERISQTLEELEKASAQLDESREQRQERINQAIDNMGSVTDRLDARRLEREKRLEEAKQNIEDITQIVGLDDQSRQNRIDNLKKDLEDLSQLIGQNDTARRARLEEIKKDLEDLTASSDADKEVLLASLRQRLDALKEDAAQALENPRKPLLLRLLELFTTRKENRALNNDTNNNTRTTAATGYQPVQAAGAAEFADALHKSMQKRELPIETEELEDEEVPLALPEVVVPVQAAPKVTPWYLRTEFIIGLTVIAGIGAVSAVPAVRTWLGSVGAKNKAKASANT